MDKLSYIKADLQALLKINYDLNNIEIMPSGRVSVQITTNINGKNQILTATERSTHNIAAAFESQILHLRNAKIVTETFKLVTNNTETRVIEKLVSHWKHTDKYPCPECGKLLGVPKYKCDECNIKLNLKMQF